MKSLFTLLVFLVFCFQSVASERDHKSEYRGKRLLPPTFKEYLNIISRTADGNKDSAKVYYDIGVKKINSGDFVEAIRYFTRALQNDSNMVAAYLNRAHAKSKLLD